MSLVWILPLNVSWAELVLVWTALVEANGSLTGHLRAYSTNADFHIHDCFFNFCQLTYKYIFWMQPAKCTDTHIHTQTIRAVARRHSALHPVVSLHACKLFSVTQILIWKSQLTELTGTREKGSKDPLSSFYCPFLLASLLHLTDTFWCQQLLILILCPFHTGYSER